MINMGKKQENIINIMKITQSTTAAIWLLQELKNKLEPHIILKHNINK